MQYKILRGDCIAAMRAIPDATFDSVVTDPPYELGFMGKAWDASGIANSVEMWREALRVLKPGGHLLAFSGSRTYHRMACAIEDAGFEIRDQIMWVYGSGFPKSLDVSKAIDKAAGAEREPGVPGRYAARRPRAEVEAVNAYADGVGDAASALVTTPATDAARQWEGWGTALKPAHEPICVARKPLVGTVAANVLAHGTGALNIDGCRVATNGETWGPANPQVSGYADKVFSMGMAQQYAKPNHDLGRWPANLIHDGSDEVLALFPDSNGGHTPAKRGAGGISTSGHAGQDAVEQHHGTGSAARFFYCAKASKSDRGPGNTHPTVKPLALMRYLLRLVTPPGGKSLDPFMGSGTTVVAGLQEGFCMTGIELLDDHADIAERRVENELYGDLI